MKSWGAITVKQLRKQSTFLCNWNLFFFFFFFTKDQGEKAGLKLNIQKTKIMASRPITS